MNHLGAIVLNEHTLGVVYPGNQLQILRASVLKGSPYPSYGLISFNPKNHPFDPKKQWRPATKQDFEDFKVLFHEEYTMSLENQMKIELELSDDHFDHYATDLYVLHSTKIYDWLKKNYQFFNQIRAFYSQIDAKLWLDIPFAGNWSK